jgi:hypothetical protein
MRLEESFLNSLAQDNLSDERQPMRIDITGVAPPAAAPEAVGPAPDDLTAAATQMAGGTEPAGATPMTIGEFATSVADVPAGLLKGAVQGTIGLPGDIESLTYGVREIFNRGAGESALDAFLTGLEQKTVLPTTENVRAWLDTNVGPLVPAGASERRREAAKIPEFVGELGGAGKTVIESAKAASRGLGQVAGASADVVRPATLEAQAGVVRPSAFMPETKQSPQKSGIGFYSAVEDSVIGLKQDKGTGAQFLAQITKTAGVKPEELKWTGLDEFLKGKKSVTKDEILNYLNTNRVDVQEVRLGEPEAYDALRLSQLEKEFKSLKQHPIDDPSFGQEKYDELIRLMNIRDRSTTTNLYNLQESAMRAGQRAQARGMPEAAERYFREAELYGVRAEKLDLEGQGMLAPPKFETYVLPGGENYREILLTLPEDSSRIKNQLDALDAEAKRLSDAGDPRWREVSAQRGELLRQQSRGTYRSSHFDQPNILAHMRVNDRVVDGKKTLFIEEIQSDWHQAGRKKGYQTQTRPVNEIQKDLDAVVNELRSKPGVSYSPSEEDWARYPEITARFDALSAERTAAASKSQYSVPDAPFKTSWHELTLKRAIQEASEKGYDQIAFTTGKTQAERYDLSQQIDEINVVGRTNAATGERTKSVALDTTDGKSLRFGVNNQGIVDNVSDSSMSNFVGKGLDEVIGKDLAKKIMDGGSQTISGEGLKVGGEGMKGFYDNILPKSLDKLAKKFDAKVGKTEMDGVEVWQMDITPKMRESVTTKGQPLFQVGTGAGAAAGATTTMQDNEERM